MDFSIFSTKVCEKNESKISQNMMGVRIWFLLNILRINEQNSTKFCIHIVIDKIYVGILKRPFFAILQLGRVTALD